MDRSEELCIEMRHDVLWLTINRPGSRNALSRATLAAIGETFAAYEGNPEIKAAVITGSGTKAFAAGGDLKELATIIEKDDAAAFFDESCRALDRIRTFPVLTVAALNGTALGGGAELALACDFRVASSESSIGYIQARLGISCGFGGGADLVRRIGSVAALAHTLRAEPLKAPQALALGLVDSIVPDGTSLKEGVQQFLAPMISHPVQTIRAHKAIANARRTDELSSPCRALEREHFVSTWVHPDHWRAVDAMKNRLQENSQ